MKNGRRRQIYDVNNIDLATVSDELSLLNLGDTEGLNVKIHTPDFHREIEALSDQCVDYLPRPDRTNNRK